MVSFVEDIIKMSNSIKVFPRIKEYEPLVELYPPQPANKFLPDWYKSQTKLQREDPDTLFASSCPAIKGYMLDGIVFPLWSDIEITIEHEEQVTWNVRVGDSLSIPKGQHWVQTHHNSQTKGMNINSLENIGALKFIPPYYIKTEENIGLEFIDTFYHFRKDLRLLPGQVETDIWNEVNFPFEFYKDVKDLIGTTIKMEAGTPLILAKPYDIKRDKYEVDILEYNDKATKEFIKNDVLNAASSYDWTTYRKRFRK